MSVPCRFHASGNIYCVHLTVSVAGTNNVLYSVPVSETLVGKWRPFLRYYLYHGASESLDCI